MTLRSVPGKVPVDADLGVVPVVERVVGALPLQAAQGVGAHAELHDVLEDAVAAEDLEAGVAEDVVGETQPRRELVGEGEFDRRRVGIRRVGRVAGQVFRFGPEADIEGQPAADRPAVLEVEGPAVHIDVVVLAVGTGGVEAADGVIAVGAAPVVGAVGDAVLVPAEIDDGLLGAVVHVLVTAHELDTGLDGVLAPGVEVVGEVGVEAEPAGQPLVQATDLGPGEALPACGVLEIGRYLGEHGVRDIGVGTRLFQAERIIRRRGGRGDRVVLVGEEIAAAHAEQTAVAQGQVGISAGREVGIRVAEGVVIRRLVGAHGVRLVARVGHGIAPAVILEQVHDDAGPGPQLPGRLGRELNGAVPALFDAVVGVDARSAPVGHVHGPVPVEVAGREGGEEPELVLLDVAAEHEAALEGILLVLADIDVVRVIAGLGIVGHIEVQPVAALALEGRARVVPDDLAVEGVAAGAGDDVDDAADRPAVLGVVAGGLDLDLFGEIEDDVLFAGAVDHVGGVRAVDVEDVLGPRRAVDRDAAEKVVLALDAGDDGHQRIEAPALGQGREGLGREDLAAGLALDVDERSLADDHDFLFDGGGHHLDVDDQGLFDPEDDVVTDDGREALEIEGDRISPRRKGQETVGAVGIGDRRRRSDEPWPFRFDGDAGKGPSLVI